MMAGLPRVALSRPVSAEKGASVCWLIDGVANGIGSLLV